MDYINMSHRISYNIPNVKIARYYWLKFNMYVQRYGHVDGQESTVTFPRPILLMDFINVCVISNRLLAKV
jgi:hypothetical protein